MSTGKVVLYTSKVLKNGEHPIMLRISKDRKSKYISVGSSCPVALWDAKLNLPKKKHPLYHELSVLIETKMLEAKKLLVEMRSEAAEFSAEEITVTLKGSTKAKQQALQFFDTCVAALKKQNRIGTAEIFKSTRNSLSNFRKKKDFDFSFITPGFLWKYHEGLVDRGVTLNSIFVYMRTFQRLVNMAKEEKMVKKAFDPFAEFGFAKYRKEKPRKRAISKEDIKKIGAFEAEEGSALFHARNYFMFSYYNRGINFIDMAHLTWESVREGRLNYVRQKTRKAFTMAILEPAAVILKYYKDNYYDGPQSFVFPILNRDFLTPQSVKNRCKKVISEVNASLKQIAQELELTEHRLTTYVARHSFATVMKRSGQSVSIISEAMGHDSESTTQIYLDSFENDVLDEASKVLL